MGPVILKIFLTTTTARHRGVNLCCLAVCISVSILVGAQAIFPVELIDTSLGSRCLLRAGVERMALGANFDVDFRRCGTGHEGVAAVAGYSCLIILGMDSLSHFFPPYLDA